MRDIADAAKEYIESEAYHSIDWDYTEVTVSGQDGEYAVTITISKPEGDASITYLFQDARFDEEESDDKYEVFSANVSMTDCTVSGFHADVETNYYLDTFNRYLAICKSVEGILDSIDLYYGERTYF